MLYILAKLFNICLDRRLLDSHTCFCGRSSVMWFWLNEAHEENLASHIHEEGKIKDYLNSLFQ